MRPTEIQMETLLDFLEKNPGITKGLLRSSMGKMETKRKWQSLANTLNSLGGAIKDGPGWAKFWTDKKYSLKKQQSARNQSANRTGGGRDFLPELTPIEERMLTLLGGDRFATGDREYSVPLFSEQLNIEESPLSPMTPQVEYEVEVSGDINAENPIPQPSSSSVLTTSIQSPLQPSTPRPLQSTSPPRVPQPSNTARSSVGSRAEVRRRRESGRPYTFTSRLQEERDRLTEIEAKRVEAELLQAQNSAAVAAAINRLDTMSIASAINRLADAVDNIAHAINRFAEKGCDSSH